jgi:hypothetical protein
MMNKGLFMLFKILLISTLLLFTKPLFAQVFDEPTARAKALKKCDSYNLPKLLCNALVTSFFDAAIESNEQGSLDNFEDYLSNNLKDNILKSDEVLNEVVFNSGLLSSKLEDSPLSLKFKAIDVEDDDTVMGLEFAYNREFARNYLNASKTMRRYYTFEFDVSGTVTQKAEENPRDFIEAKASFLGGAYTRIPTQPKMVTDIAQYYVDNIDDEVAQKAFWNAMDDVTKPLGGFTYFKYGIEAGFETEQDFDAKNTVITAFAFTQYESWDDGTFLGSLGLIPSARFALDEVNPNSETPRALAGDNSSYRRVSGELSLWMPISQYTGKSMFFTFNYRTYRELSANDVIKNANLDKYHLRTYTIGGPSGLYLSYTSGSLPFDLQSQQSVELGFKTYF